LLAGAFALAALFLPWSASPLLSKPYIAITGVDADTDFPTIHVTVSITGNSRQKLDDLNEEHLYLYEDGYRVNYINVKKLSDRAEPVYLALAMDSSRSLRAKDMGKIKKTVAEFIDNLPPGTMVALYRFNDEVKLLSAFTGDRALLKKALEGLNTHGRRTQLLNSIFDSLELLGRVEGSRKAVVVFTDGMDEGSSIETGDIISIARERGVPVFFNYPGEKTAVHSLNRIARMTGGKTLAGMSGERVKRLQGWVFGSFSDLYDVRYKSALSNDGKPHLLEVRLKYDTLRDRDTRQIVLKRRLLDVSFPSLYQFLIILMVLLMLAILALLLVFFIRRGNRYFRPNAVPTFMPGVAPSREPRISRVIDEDLRSREIRDRVLTPQDPEYVYSKAWLVQKDGPEMGKKFPVFWEEISIGRDDENTIVVKDEAVSLKHVKIKEMKGAYYIFDLASDNGTFLNDNKLLRPKPLYDWDEIRIGRTLFIFRGSKIT